MQRDYFIVVELFDVTKFTTGFNGFFRVDTVDADEKYFSEDVLGMFSNSYFTGTGGRIQ